MQNGQRTGTREEIELINDNQEFVNKPNDEYFDRLSDLTAGFSKRGSDPDKPNGNPINQVRTNDFVEPLWDSCLADARV